MPLSGTGPVLGAALQAALDAAVAGDGPPDRGAAFRAMGEAIITHIIANGVGAVLGTSAPGGGPVVSTIT
jgi:hypothetical protein